MKIFRKIAMMAFVAASFMLAGCTEEDQKIIGDAINEAILDNLVGTHWSYYGTETYEGVTAKIYSTIHFTSETEGEIFISSIYDGDTVEGGDRITYTYNKPNGVMTLYIDGESAGNMDFTVGLGVLNLKIRNGEATRTYKQETPNNPPDPPSNELVCSEWGATIPDGTDSETIGVLCFLDNQKAILISIGATPDDFDYIIYTYTINGDQGRMVEIDDENEIVNFTIDGNSITLSDNETSLTLFRRRTTPPQSLEGTSWSMTFPYEEYYDEETEEYYEQNVIATCNFRSNGRGSATQSYEVPELDMSQGYAGDLTYTYNRPYCDILATLEGATLHLNTIVLSDLMIMLKDNGDLFGYLNRVSK